MNQEKIGKMIKNIRIKDGLSQQKFAEKYGVTYQAVSKWETGKNIPDIAILKQICEDYKMDINDFLEVNGKRNKQTKKPILIGLVIFLLLLVIFLFLIFNNQNDFELKSLSTTCDNFNLYGSIAYDDTKTSIHISNVTYCGEADDTLYKKLECTLYETNKNTKIAISDYRYDKEKMITLEEFLKDVHFRVDNYEKTCKSYEDNSLHLEIDAYKENGQIKSYKIPLKLEKSCNS